MERCDSKSCKSATSTKYLGRSPRRVLASIARSSPDLIQDTTLSGLIPHKAAMAGGGQFSLQQCVGAGHRETSFACESCMQIRVREGCSDPVPIFGTSYLGQPVSGETLSPSQENGRSMPYACSSSDAFLTRPRIVLPSWVTLPQTASPTSENGTFCWPHTASKNRQVVGATFSGLNFQ